MADCQFCGRALANNRQVVYRCENCGAAFCSNGNCSGSHGSGRSNSYCKACQKPNVVGRV